MEGWAGVTGCEWVARRQKTSPYIPPHSSFDSLEGGDPAAFVDKVNLFACISTPLPSINPSPPLPTPPCSSFDSLEGGDPAAFVDEVNLFACISIAALPLMIPCVLLMDGPALLSRCGGVGGRLKVGCWEGVLIDVIAQ